MKAYHLNGHAGAGSLVRADVGKPEPANGEVRVRVEAASLNYRDLLILDAAGQGGLNGRVPLCDGAGVVDAIGSGVTQWQVGDRVAASYFRDWISGPFNSSYIPSALGSRTLDGMLAEYVVLPATALVSVPEHLSSIEAATLPCAAVTAWHGLIARGGMRKGDTLLVQGTGGVALFGLQFADLGGGLIKQRVARPGQGKRGGFRTIVVYRRGSRAVFLFGFAKSERENLDDDEMAQWQRVGRAYLGLDDEGLEAAIAADELMEVSYGGEGQGQR
jgi:NADPH:quinone reductase-like Zn-dependent oxidoreductase